MTVAVANARAILMANRTRAGVCDRLRDRPGVGDSASMGTAADVSDIYGFGSDRRGTLALTINVRCKRK